MPQQIIDGYLSELVPAALPFDDPAIQFGVLGFFETLRVERRAIHLFEPHFARLDNALEHWKIAWPCDRELLIKGIARELHQFAPESQLRLRISVGPEPNANPSANEKSPGRAFIAAHPLPSEYRGLIWSRPPISATVCSEFFLSSTAPLAGFKCSQYLMHWEARRRARAAGFDEAILSNERGELAEGSISNLFWMTENTIFTPAKATGCLPGIFATYLTMLACAEGLKVTEVCEPASTLEAAETIFFTNSLGEIMSRRNFADKSPTLLRDHPIGRRLIEMVEDRRTEREDLRL